MGLEQRIDDDYTTAMRAGETFRRDTLRLVRASLKNAAIEAREALDDDAVTRVLQREAKQRRDSIEQFEAGQRADLADIERGELKIIEGYLPTMMTESEVEVAASALIEEVGASSPADIGKVMGPLMKSLAGRADGKLVNVVVRRLLNG